MVAQGLYDDRILTPEEFGRLWDRSLSERPRWLLTALRRTGKHGLKSFHRALQKTGGASTQHREMLMVLVAKGVCGVRACVRVCVRACVCVCVCACVRVSVSSCNYVCLYVCVYQCINVNVCMYVCEPARMLMSSMVCVCVCVCMCVVFLYLCACISLSALYKSNSIL